MGARRLYKQERYQAAMTDAKRVLNSNKDNEEALFYVAHGLYYARCYRRSLLYWRRLEKLNPTEPSLHLNMGACFELNPACGHALYNLGALYCRSHKYKLASGYLERCYSQKHSVDATVGKLAWCYFKTGHEEKEQMLYEDFLQTHPNDTWALNNLGSHYIGKGAYYRALLRLRKAASLEPGNKLVAKNLRTVERCLRKLKSPPIS
jgi:tetratricopeptide (TPR) repeat protein